MWRVDLSFQSLFLSPFLPSPLSLSEAKNPTPHGYRFGTGIIPIRSTRDPPAKSFPSSSLLSLFPATAPLPFQLQAHPPQPRAPLLPLPISSVSTQLCPFYPLFVSQSGWSPDCTAEPEARPLQRLAEPSKQQPAGAVQEPAEATAGASCNNSGCSTAATIGTGTTTTIGGRMRRSRQ